MPPAHAVLCCCCARTPRCFETHSSRLPPHSSPPRRDRHSSRLSLFPALLRAASLSVTDVCSPGSRLGSPFLAAAAHRLAGRPVPLCAPAGRLSAHHESPSFIGTSTLRPISVPIPPSATRPPLLRVSAPGVFHSPRRTTDSHALHQRIPLNPEVGVSARWTAAIQNHHGPQRAFPFLGFLLF